MFHLPSLTEFPSELLVLGLQIQPSLIYVGSIRHKREMNRSISGESSPTFSALYRVQLLRICNELYIHTLSH
jgi:hypothetical protein